MRPKAIRPDEELYECTGCGARVRGADTRLCDDCGGALTNISRDRDL